MSKIGRKPIDPKGVRVEIQDNVVTYTGKKASGTHVLPPELSVVAEGKQLLIKVSTETKNANALWGLHRSLLANKIHGAEQGFETQLRIVGLGFKAALTGGKLQLALGFSHKIDFALPREVTVEIDKTGQLLTLKSVDKELLGLVCSKVRALRPPEPYKGTGIQYVNEVILRKAGKAKSA